jgi:hypothetical protein
VDDKSRSTVSSALSNKRACMAGKVQELPNPGGYASPHCH